MSHHFVPEAWREFLEGGHVSTVHIEPIPIWAGFLIAQNADLREQVADLRNQIGVLLMTQAISLHTMFQGDMDAIQAAFNQLVAVNTANKQNAQQMLAQIAALQAQLATGGDPVSMTDLSRLNDFTAQIQQASASTITTITPAVPTTPPATTAPATPDSGTTTAATGTGVAAPSDTSTAAPAVTVPDATPVPATTAPEATTVPDTTAPSTVSSWSTPVSASDTGAGA
ncbi:hypothetical protein [Nocardia niigatensis]|uniref:hypothetical protein n=1 Tax=Nocardia niigatensis TaxID=209249 RepID=UPI0002DAF5B4|nr:hypothetical protein [Nocardia niigatensis]